MCVCVCEGFCITPTSSYAMLKHQLTLHNFYCLFPNQMKWKKIERYTQRKVWCTINLSVTYLKTPKTMWFSLCLQYTRIMIALHLLNTLLHSQVLTAISFFLPQEWDGSVVTVRSSTTPWCQDVNHVTSPRSTAGRELSSHELGHFDFVTVFVVCVLFYEVMSWVNLQNLLLYRRAAHHMLSLHAGESIHLPID